MDSGRACGIRSGGKRRHPWGTWGDHILHTAQPFDMIPHSSTSLTCKSEPEHLKTARARWPFPDEADLYGLLVAFPHLPPPSQAGAGWRRVFMIFSAQFPMPMSSFFLAGEHSRICHLPCKQQVTFQHHPCLHHPCMQDSPYTRTLGCVFVHPSYRLQLHQVYNLARLHGGVNWHSHCTCEVYWLVLGRYLWTGLGTPGFLKTLTPTRRNPYPWAQVRVFAAMGTGSPGIPQGYLWQSLRSFVCDVQPMYIMYNPCIINVWYISAIYD